jgi:hypothetical protein
LSPPQVPGEKGTGPKTKSLAVYEIASSHFKKGNAYRLRNFNLPYSLLVDIDSFVSQAQSTYEIFMAFIRELHKALKGKKISEK